MRTATNRTVRRAYLDLAKQCHPDKARGSKKCESSLEFQGLQLAYELLTEELARRDNRARSNAEAYSPPGARSAFGRPSNAESIDQVFQEAILRAVVVLVVDFF